MPPLSPKRAKRVGLLFAVLLVYDPTHPVGLAKVSDDFDAPLPRRSLIIYRYPTSGLLHWLDIFRRHHTRLIS